MSAGIYNIGVTGMTAAQLGLLTTEHNISNASTPGYNRQRIQQANNNPVMTGAGAIGQGTHVTTITRMYSEFLGNEVNRAQTNVSELEAYYSQISQIDNMLADSNSGLSSALQDFFSSAQQVAASPSSLPARQSLVSSAQSLMSRYHGLETRLSEIADGVNGQIVSTVGEVNSYSQQIASLNERIVIAQSSVNQPANDLLDQRDQLITELNKLIKVTTTTDSNGALNVYMGTGQQLVVGSLATTMTATASSADLEKIAIGLKSMGGSVQELPENLITGGTLGGLIQFRSQSLDPAMNKLGQVAATMALTMNAQHALGQDLLGKVTGQAGFVDNLFTLGVPRVSASSYNNPLSPTISASLTPATNNGTNFVTNLTSSDYRLDVAAGGTMTLTRLTDGTTWTGANIAAINTQLAANPQGFTLSATAGSFSANDSYLIQPTRYAARNIDVDARIVADPRLLAAAMPMRTTAGLTNAGSMKLSQGTTQQGYSLAGLPLTLTAGATQITGFPAGPVVATYANGTTQTLTGAADLTFGGATLSKVTFNGMSFDVTGTPTAGDTFTVAINNGSTGVADGRNLLLMGKLQSQGTVSGGAANYQAAYAQLVADNGNKTREVQVTASAQNSLLDQATSSREAMSGVNLDEEAANLVRYQQAYQAAAKMLSIGTKLFDTLLSINS